MEDYALHTHPRQARRLFTHPEGTSLYEQDSSAFFYTCAQVRNAAHKAQSEVDKSVGLRKVLTFYYPTLQSPSRPIGNFINPSIKGM
jgi:hypothetical protein